jgi:enoyl-CoA hydratase/3-hydroxyacyl-CoA dehydrogenase
VGKELAKYLVFTGRIITAADANAIGLVDYIFEADEIDDKILEMIAAGQMTPKKGRAADELPETWQKLQSLFADENIPDWVSGKHLGSDDPLVAKTAKIISTKAPLALKMANRIMDAGFEKPLKEGLKEELSHLNEIFSTKDALTGLTQVGRKGVTYEGK